MAADEDIAEDLTATATQRELAVARGLNQARSRAENRVQLFLDAALELMTTKAGDFTVQEVVDGSGQSLRTFYQYFESKHELLLALFEDSTRSAALHLQKVVAEGEDPVDRLHRFTVECFLMCRPKPKDQATQGPAPVMVEFAQQLLTSHPKQAARAFAPLVELLEGLLEEAAASGGIRPELDHRQAASVLLQAITFNAFTTAIRGSPYKFDGDAEPEALWNLLLRGIGTAP